MRRQRTRPAWSMVQCPTCHAQPGEPCRTIHGLATDPHNPRRREAQGEGGARA
ncbi:MAG TPA: hypothetical protein VFH78_10910 [Candidatus Thermoplasmatota archaeon]|nr:hypothetical protein [Candidatus Thermoplasmatota archaeon]